VESRVEVLRRPPTTSAAAPHLAGVSPRPPSLAQPWHFLPSAETFSHPPPISAPLSPPHQIDRRRPGPTASRPAYSPARACSSTRGAVELAWPRCAHHRGGSVRPSSRQRGWFRPPGRAGGDASHGGPSSVLCEEHLLGGGDDCVFVVST
jgi:hypothetical protein